MLVKVYMFTKTTLDVRHALCLIFAVDVQIVFWSYKTILQNYSW